VANRHLLAPLISERMRTRSKAEWRRALDDAGIPCGPVQDLEEVFADPQVEARGLRFDLPHTLHTHLPQIANPLRFDGRLHHSSGRHRCAANTPTKCCSNSATTSPDRRAGRDRRHRTGDVKARVPVADALDIESAQRRKRPWPPPYSPFSSRSS
jgi:hypothetical protein